MVNVLPYIPESITVHLGRPDEAVQNVTVSFPDYVKNVVSSEIYPTWEQSAIEANALAIISYALNRVYTRYYRSRGYDFDITSTTAFDQKFINGRNIYENVALLVDQIFDSYIRRIGFLEPLAAKFCNGTTSTCDGLSQWGSQEKAQNGETAFAILQDYYGQDIELVENAPILPQSETYPGEPLTLGQTSPYVAYLQTELNRISQNYPAIGKVRVSGVFDEATDNAVRAFQAIFSLTSDGIVGPVTWNALSRVYVAATKLSELASEGQRFRGGAFAYPGFLQEGDRGVGIGLLQYFLAVIGQFITELPIITQSGTFDAETTKAVEAFQEYAALPVTGTVDADTWRALYRQYSAIESAILSDSDLFPYANGQEGDYADTSVFLQYPGFPLSRGQSDWEEEA